MRYPKDSWDIGRPVFDRLPEKGYKDNLLADWLTQWPDITLSNKKEQLENFYKTVDPDLCPVQLLDYLAFLTGLSGNYWDTQWSEVIKRDMIRVVYTHLWPKKGTKECIQMVLGILRLDADIWTDQHLVLSFPMRSLENNPRRFGTAKLRLFIRVPYSYVRGQKDWKEAERTAKNYAPAIVDAKVVYKRFYMGFSRLGEAMFTS